MLKNSAYRIVSIFLVLCLITGCESLNIEPEIRSEEISPIGANPKDEEVEESNASEKSSNNEKHKSDNQGLTNEEKLEDFEYLFTILESNYPYFEMNKRINDIDWIANRDSYIKRLEETEGDLKYYIVMKSIVKDLNYYHTQVLDDRAYASYVNTYKNVEAKPWLEVFEDPIVQSRYYNSVQENAMNTTTKAYIVPDNIVLEKWSETSTAYIKIKSFNHFNIVSDWEEIKPFINDIDDCHSLIIDIRGNGGGDSHYWSDYLVPELIYEKKIFNQYFCFKGGEYSESFIDFVLGYNYSEMEMIDQNFFKEFSSDLPEEIKTDFKYYVKMTNIIEPVDEVGYRGDIYLLVDNRVFSSSDKFVQFAKDCNFAYIIGEPTLGEGSGFDNIVLRLPNSGYVIPFPVGMVLSSNGFNREEFTVEPDLLTEGKNALDEAIELIRIKNN